MEERRPLIAHRSARLCRTLPISACRTGPALTFCCRKAVQKHRRSCLLCTFPFLPGLPNRSCSSARAGANSSQLSLKLPCFLHPAFSQESLPSFCCLFLLPAAEQTTRNHTVLLSRQPINPICTSVQFSHPIPRMHPYPSPPTPASLCSITQHLDSVYPFTDTAVQV